MDAIHQVVSVLVYMAQQAFLAVEAQARQPLAAMGLAQAYQTAVLILVDVVALVAAMRWLHGPLRFICVLALMILLIQLTSPYTLG
jgi:hypothetical protein